MASYVLIIPILISFFVTLFLVPIWMKRARNVGLIGKDVHKLGDKQIPESGGITVLVGFIAGILIFVAVQTFFYNSSTHTSSILAFIAVVLMASFIGFVDDILGWKIGLNKKSRMILLIFASIPLIVINAGQHEIGVPFDGPVNIGILYSLILIPLGVVGATTTYNFLAGYNGLEAGQGIIILSALSAVAYFTGNSWLAIAGLCMVAALFAFLFFNYCPAKVLPGDSLTYAVGSLIAVMAILGNFERTAVFFFIPYILEVALKLRGRLVKQSFAKLQRDESLDLQYDKLYSLNHVAIAFMKKLKVKPTERGIVFCVWTFQILVILVGFLIFRKGIFY